METYAKGKSMIKVNEVRQTQQHYQKQSIEGLHIETGGSSSSEPRFEILVSPVFTNFNLDCATAKKLISELRNNLKLNQTKVIWTLWKATPGESQAYKKALEQYKELTKDDE